MSALALATSPGVIGPTGFALLTWGSLLLVAVAFGYVAWTVLVDLLRTRRTAY